MGAEHAKHFLLRDVTPTYDGIGHMNCTCPVCMPWKPRYSGPLPVLEITGIDYGQGDYTTWTEVRFSETFRDGAGI